MLSFVHLHGGSFSLSHSPLSSNSLLTRFVERVVVAGEDESARRLGVERGDDVVEGDLLAEDEPARRRGVDPGAHSLLSLSHSDSEWCCENIWRLFFIKGCQMPAFNCIRTHTITVRSALSGSSLEKKFTLLAYACARYWIVDPISRCGSTPSDLNSGLLASSTFNHLLCTDVLSR